MCTERRLTSQLLPALARDETEPIRRGVIIAPLNRQNRFVGRCAKFQNSTHETLIVLGTLSSTAGSRSGAVAIGDDFEAERVHRRYWAAGELPHSSDTQACVGRRITWPQTKLGPNDLQDLSSVYLA
jgi:hypothetical protein